MSPFSNDLVLSLVDDVFTFASPRRPEPICFPAYAATQEPPAKTTKLLAYGEEAKAMWEKTPGNIKIHRTMAEGRPLANEVGVAMLQTCLRAMTPKTAIIKPRVLVACRAGSAGKTLKDLFAYAGSRELYLMEMGMATAIGLGLQVTEPTLRAVLVLSNDWFELSVISLAGVVAGIQGSLGVDDFVEDIQNHMLLQQGFRPEGAALKAKLLSMDLSATTGIDLEGWQAWAGSPGLGKSAGLRAEAGDLRVGMSPSLVRLCERINACVRGLSDTHQFALQREVLHLCGEGARILGLDRLLAKQLGQGVQAHPSDVPPSMQGLMTVLGELPGMKKMYPQGFRGLKPTSGGSAHG